jgi:hypothetical protein
MEVAFQLDFNVGNPNHFPVPITEMLTAVTVFPADAKQRLGASCVVFCPPGSSGCSGQPGPGACQSSERDIESASDFANAAQDFVVSAGLQLAAGQPPTFAAPQISAEANIPLSAIFAFGPEPLLAALKELALQSVAQLGSGQDVTFEIPFQIEGTVWFNVGSLGRVAVGYGPIAGTFTVPAEQLVSGFVLP